MIQVTHQMVAKAAGLYDRGEGWRAILAVAVADINAAMQRYAELDAQAVITDDESRELAQLAQTFAPLTTPAAADDAYESGRRGQRYDSECDR